MICQLCQVEFPSSMKINGKVRKLNRRKLCLVCSPWGHHNTKTAAQRSASLDVPSGFRRCTVCGEVKVLSLYSPRGGGRFVNRCKPCESKRVGALQKALKERAVAYKGGRCQICGYSKYIGALDFHHLDPKLKEFEIGQSRYSFSELVRSELDKCVLLCRCCHAEVHAGVTALEVVPEGFEPSTLSV